MIVYKAPPSLAPNYISVLFSYEPVKSLMSSGAGILHWGLSSPQELHGFFDTL